jgi:hypothetical protein
LEQIELSATLHLSFDELEFGDLSFGLGIDQGETIAARTAASSLLTPLAKEATTLVLALAIPGSEFPVSLFADHGMEIGDDLPCLDQQGYATFNSRHRGSTNDDRHANVPTDLEPAREIWEGYSGRWQFWNQVRTVASGAALVRRDRADEIAWNPAGGGMTALG